MIYLKKVILKIDKEIPCEKWTQALGEEGIEVVRLEAKAGECFGEMLQNGAAQSLPSLVITDDSETAHEILQAGGAVLVLLHEGNRDGDFSNCRYACENLPELDALYLDRVYRRYRGIPWDILETDRCYLRESTPEDVDSFYEIYKDPAITKYMENLFEDRDREIAYTRDYIRNVYEFFGFGIWTVCLKETGQVIGRAGLSYREGFEEPELGFVIGVPWQRQGIAEEVCRAVLQFGREELEFTDVIAFVEPENKVSAHLLEKMGFQASGEEVLLGRAHIRMKIKTLG